MPLVCFSWGITDYERRLKFPCDSYVETFDATYYRAVTIEASQDIIYRILGQLRVTLNDFKAYKPSEPIPESERLIAGQTVLGFFEILSYEQNRHLTVCTRKGSHQSKVFGDVCVSYVIVPQTEALCRLLVKYLITYPRAIGWILRFVLPWGDLIMMRRQLLRIKKISERVQKTGGVISSFTSAAAID